MKKFIKNIVVATFEILATSVYHTYDKFARLSYRFLYYVSKHSFQGRFVVAIDRSIAETVRYSLFEKVDGKFKSYIFEGVYLKDIVKYLAKQFGW